MHPFAGMKRHLLSPASDDHLSFFLIAAAFHRKGLSQLQLLLLHSEGGGPSSGYLSSLESE